MIRRIVIVAAVAVALGLAAPRVAPAQEPAATPTPTPAATGNGLLDQIGEAIDSGRLQIEIDLSQGRVPAAPGWELETKGSPKASMTIDAAGGHVRHLDVGVDGGTLLVRGRGLRPRVFVESIAFEDGKGITAAKFRGKGIWRPIVGIFRGLAMSALRKLEFRSDIPSVLRGDLFAERTPTPGKGKAAVGAGPPPRTPPTPVAPAPSATPGPSFFDLVREVRVSDSELVAGGGKPLAFGDAVRFDTARAPASGAALRVAVDKGSYRPGHAGAASSIALTGRIDGEIENGAVAFGGSRSTFSRGALRGGRFEMSTSESGDHPMRIAAASFAVDLSSGEFRLPGGPEVTVDPPSHVAFRDLSIEPDGNYSALFDADLQGKVGRIVRAGSIISASDIHLKTAGTRVVSGRATGDLDLEFQYRVDYPFEVHYPMKEIGTRRITLLFQGPFTTRLHYEDAGADSGVVDGTYSFKVPWPPVERAALEVLKARWSQDVTAVVKKVDFDIEPRRFSPCGGQCFLLDLGVTAEKKSGRKSLFKQICEPEGKADLVIDAPSRSFVLRNVVIEPRCKGVVGWLVNFLMPLLKKSYSDITLFQMPENLPFTIEKVGSGMNWLAISGRVVWEADREPTAGNAEK